MPESTQLNRIEARLGRIEQKLDAVLALTRAQLTEDFLMAANLDTITQKVTAIETVDASALALIQALADEVRSTPATQAAIDALATRLDTSASALAAAVTANTPAPAPVPTPDPTPAPAV